MSDRNFFAELKRRNVYKVAVAHVVGDETVVAQIQARFGDFDSAIAAIPLLLDVPRRQYLRFQNLAAGKQ